MIVTYLTNLFLFCETLKLIAWKQEHASGPYLESAEANPHLHTPSPQMPFPLQIFRLKFCVHLSEFSNGHFLKYFPTKVTNRIYISIRSVLVLPVY
jgi:hypothetical protein